MRLLFFTNPLVQKQGGALDEIFIPGFLEEMRSFLSKDLMTLDDEN